MSIFNKENFKNILPSQEKFPKSEPFSSTEEMINHVKSLPKSKSKNLITALAFGAATFFSNQAKAQESYGQDKNINPTEATTKVVTKTKIVTDVNGRKTVEKYVLRGSGLDLSKKIENTPNSESAGDTLNIDGKIYKLTSGINPSSVRAGQGLRVLGGKVYKEVGGSDNFNKEQKELGDWKPLPDSYPISDAQKSMKNQFKQINGKWYTLVSGGNSKKIENTPNSESAGDTLNIDGKIYKLTSGINPSSVRAGQGLRVLGGKVYKEVK